MRRARLLLLALALLFPTEVRAAKEEGITAKGWALIEASSGRLLLGENEHDKLPMASTTKIMTALLLLEAGEDLDTEIEVDPRAAGTEGSSLYLRAGERMSLKDLLYGLMMQSGNDAAVALAIHAAGSVGSFVQRMNAKAAALGLEDTHFVNPNGLHDPDHYTSACDLCRLGAAAMARADFRELVATERYTTSTGDRVRTFKSKNRMLTEVPGGCGVKTGYTRKAGRCLGFAARREGMLLVGAVLNAPDMWGDGKKIVDRGFSEYELRTFLLPGQTVGRVPVTGSAKKTLPAAAKEGILYPVRRDGQDAAQLDVHLAAGLTAPAAPGDGAGEAVLTVNGARVSAVPLAVAEGAEPLTFGWFLRKVTEGYLVS